MTGDRSTVVYLDANAFAKLYLDEETGQEIVLQLVDQYGKVACCAITYAEVSAVFARYFHEGKLDEAAYSEVMEAFQADWQTVKVYDVDITLSRVAALLTKAHKTLRAMDALHLASALALRQFVPIKFLTFDARLKAVAQNVMPENVT